MKEQLTLTRNAWCILALVALQLCSIRPFFKYLPHPMYGYPAMVILSGLFYFWLFKHASARLQILRSPVITVLLCLLVVAVNVYLYPRADALRTVLRGSDADDAVIIAAGNLLHGQYPYASLTYLGHKMSPGPGMLLLMSPFVATGLYVLAIPFYVILFVLALKRIFNSYLLPNIALVLLISCAGFWEYMIIGSDLVVIGVLLALLPLWIFQHVRNTRVLIFLAVITGIFLTSRITFFYLIPILAFAVYRQHKRAGWLFGIIAAMVCAGLHFFFYQWQPANYSPLHLLGKGQHATNGIVLVGAAISTLATLIMFIRARQLNRWSALFYCWLLILVPHFFIGIGMVITDKFNWSVSEGPGYLVIQVFIFLCSLLGLYSWKQQGVPAGHPSLAIPQSVTV